MIKLRYILAFILIFCCVGAGAQRSTRRPRQKRPPVEVRLAASSTNPEEDSLVFLKMRAKMDKIRKEQKRPTVALVLSGGGAKGAAHASVIKYIEEQQIPVDMVLGTSMGGLIGGLFALGYTGDELDTLVRGMDWSLALSDKIGQVCVTYKRKMRQQRQLMSLPSH